MASWRTLEITAMCSRVTAGKILDDIHHGVGRLIRFLG